MQIFMLYFTSDPCVQRAQYFLFVCSTFLMCAACIVLFPCVQHAQYISHVCVQCAQYFFRVCSVCSTFLVCVACVVLFPCDRYAEAAASRYYHCCCCLRLRIISQAICGPENIPPRIYLTIKFYGAKLSIFLTNIFGNKILWSEIKYFLHEYI